MLKSVIDSAPILFVKIGQKSAGAIDFKLKSPEKSNALMCGNVNFNSIDPFDDPFAIKRDDDWPFPDDGMNANSHSQVEYDPSLRKAR